MMKTRCFWCRLLLLSTLLSTQAYADDIIDTIAGSQAAGYSGDKGPATAAQLSNPTSVALDNSGNLYIADTFNHRIRKVDTQGKITTIAGNGEYGDIGNSGDGQAATKVQLCAPYGVAVDETDQVYVTEYCAHRLRKIDAQGVITTVAGNGSSGYAGDGGMAIDAQFNRPTSVTLDNSGNIYIADSKNQRIRRIDTSGVITTVAGDGSVIELNVFLGGEANVEGLYGGDGGPATAAQLNLPMDIALDKAGNFYIADTDNNCIRKVDTDGNITTLVGNGNLIQLNHPVAVNVNEAGVLYIADTDNHRILEVTPTETVTTIAGNGSVGSSGDGGPATAAKLKEPRDVIVARTGELYIADYGNHRIRVVSPELPTDLPDLGKNKGSAFFGGVAVETGSYQQQAEVTELADFVDFRGRITVNPDHVGQKARIFVYAKTTLLEVEGILYFMLDEATNILSWDGENTEDLVAFIPNVTLKATEDFSMYQGLLLAGGLNVFFGYILDDGTMASNQTSIDVTINR